MLNRLIRNTWDLDNFIKEVQDKHPNSFSEEALEVIFNNLEDYPGYCCIEELTKEFEEWSFEKFISYINRENKSDYLPKDINQLFWDLYGDDGDDEIVGVLYETRTIVVTKYF